MRFLISSILILGPILLCGQELVKTEWEQGYVKDGKKISTWQYFNSKKEPELVINHTSGRVMFISQDSSRYFINKNGIWVASKLDIHPVPIEGSQNFFKAIRNAVNYTEKDFRNSVEGNVVVLFEIDTAGSSVNYSLAKSIGCECDSVVVQSLKTIDQKWIPAKVGGKKYPSRFAIDIEFRLKLNERHFEQHEFTLKDAKLLTQIIVAGEEKVYNFVEKSAEFPGGMNALSGFLSRTLRYPAEARRYGIQGKVIVKFVVEADGSISTVEVLKGTSKELNEEAIRVVSLMPRWNPGEIKGVPVRQAYVLPIMFKLDDNTKRWRR